jgi:hypothetical protein
MMKAALLFLMILIGGYWIQALLPWWGLNVVALIAAFLTQLKPLKSFALAFLAAFLLWGSVAWWQSAQGEHLLSEKIAALFGETSVIMLCMGTALIGGILAGFGALTGSLGRALLDPLTPKS